MLILEIAAGVVIGEVGFSFAWAGIQTVVARRAQAKQVARMAAFEAAVAQRQATES
jgi:hypothetical protein